MVSIHSALTPHAHAAPQPVRRPLPQQPATATQQQAKASPAAASNDNSSDAPDFRKLFTGVTTPVVPQPPSAANTAPTAESVFGENPWITNPTALGPLGTYSLNPIDFATPQTAAKVAEMLGGKVVAGNQLVSGGPFSQQQPNELVEMPDGRLVNAGLVAAFYTHGYPQSYIDQLIAGVKNGIA